MSSRIGKGPWSRAFATMLVPDEATSDAQRGKELWLAGAVHDLRVEPGLITATVDGCAVTLSTQTVPPRIWSAMTTYAKNRGALERAVNGELQSVHLEHLMTQDWDEPLVPPVDDIVRRCSCPDDGACEHFAAMGYAVAEAIDEAPLLLLRWRGCAAESAAKQVREPNAGADPWSGSAPPELSRGRGRPAGSVPRRLGASGIRVGAVDLSDALGDAYAALAAGGGRAHPPASDLR